MILFWETGASQFSIHPAFPTTLLSLSDSSPFPSPGFNMQGQALPSDPLLRPVGQGLCPLPHWNLPAHSRPPHVLLAQAGPWLHPGCSHSRCVFQRTVVIIGKPCPQLSSSCGATPTLIIPCCCFDHLPWAGVVGSAVPGGWNSQVFRFPGWCGPRANIFWVGRDSPRINLVFIRSCSAVQHLIGRKRGLGPFSLSSLLQTFFFLLSLPIPGP